MKYLCLILISLFSFAHAKEVSSKVDNVVVFKDRAFVTRGFQSVLSPGNISLILTKLPTKLIQDSLKVKASDNKNLKVLGLRIKEREIIKTENKEILNLQELREKNKNKIADKVSAVKRLVNENHKLNELQEVYKDSFAINLQQSKWTSKSFNSFVSFTKNQRLELIAAWEKDYKELLKLYEEKEYIDSKLNELNSLSSTRYLDVFVDLEVTKKGSYEFSLQYLINGAHWQPVYDIRVNSKEAYAQVYQYAYVNQSTGEDWTKSKIELSNRQAKLNTTPPSISAYTLNYKEVKKVKTSIQTTSDNAQSLGTSFSNNDQEEYKFIVSGVQTIKSGNPRTRVFIKSRRSEYKEHLEVVPKLYDYVFRKGTLKNTFKWNLQAGVAYIYYDNQFIQTMNLAKVIKSQEFFINAGIDYDVKVTHWHSNKNSEKGIINSKKVYKRTFHTKLENFSRNKKKIKVLAQYPVSETKEIQVTTDGSSKGLKELSGYPSWSYWDLSLGANRQEVVNLKVEVTAPKDFGFKW